MRWSAIREVIIISLPKKDKELLDKKIREQKATISQLKRVVNYQQKSLNVADRIIEIIQDSVVSTPAIRRPKSFKYEGKPSEETAFLLLSDTQIGKKTKSYNIRKFEKRLESLKSGMMKIITPLRTFRPINKLVIGLNGDIVDGESLYPSQNIDGIDVRILDQIFSVGLPRLAEFILFCLANFDEVTIYAVRGNHGKNVTRRDSSRTTNWDLVLYKALEAITANQKRLKWNIAIEDWKNIFRIYNHKFLMAHGDQFKAHFQFPYYSMGTKSIKWADLYGAKFFLYGHWHSIHTGWRLSTIQIFVNGSFVSDDDFGEEVVGAASFPEQLLFGVHPKQGITWRYRISLDI